MMHTDGLTVRRLLEEARAFRAARERVMLAARTYRDRPLRADAEAQRPRSGTPRSQVFRRDCRATRGRVEEDAMRVIHFERTSDTGHAVPWCGVWGSMDTDWTEDAAGVTCVACRAVMPDRPRGLHFEDASTRGSAIARRRAPARSSFALRYLGAALVAWVGAWSLIAVSGVLPQAGSRATTVFLWLTAAILVLSGAAFAALARTELGLGMHRGRTAGGHPTS